MGKKERVKVHEVLLDDFFLRAVDRDLICVIYKMYLHIPQLMNFMQPSDHGWLDQEEVVFVERRGNDVFHGEKSQAVKQTVDWELRFDRMQQHTGQHIVTAIADKCFGFYTTSWWLGDKVCHIELGIKSTSKELDEKIAEMTSSLKEETILLNGHASEIQYKTLKHACADHESKYLQLEVRHVMGTTLNMQATFDEKTAWFYCLVSKSTLEAWWHAYPLELTQTSGTAIGGACKEHRRNSLPHLILEEPSLTPACQLDKGTF